MCYNKDMEEETILKIDGIKASDQAKQQSITTDEWIEKMEKQCDKFVIHSCGEPDSILYVTGQGWMDNRRY